MLHEKGGNTSCGTKKSKSNVKKGDLWKNALSLPETKESNMEDGLYENFFLMVYWEQMQDWLY